MTSNGSQQWDMMVTDNCQLWRITEKPTQKGNAGDFEEDWVAKKANLEAQPLKCLVMWILQHSWMCMKKKNTSAGKCFVVEIGACDS